jgi:TonB-dependent SusC/RagA subfamily outer membrane receptor
MKKLIAFTAIMGLTIAAFAQKADSTKNVTIKIRGNAISDAKQPLIVIDGNKQFTRDINQIALEPDNIESINILKDNSAVSTYGADGFAGVIEIKTKGSKERNNLTVLDSNMSSNLKGKIYGLTVRPGIAKPGAPNGSGFSISKLGIKLRNDASSPLYIVDGKEADSTITMDQDSIKSIEILKDAAAKKLYGDKANNGVIIITTKNAKALPEKN